MSEDDPPTVEQLFQQALDVPPEQRARYLDEQCADAPARRAEVEDLLRHYEAAADGFLHPPPGTEITAPAEPAPGAIIGRYTLLETIGEGGTGIVFLAEQKEPVHRRLALKIIKLGMDTKQVIARFEAEWQTLAILNHSCIAKLFDAGFTQDGRPFFVMEYVPGSRITDFSDRHELTIEQRLDVFLQVCDAIQHAHQHGVIHRDIKPSNVLVSEEDEKTVPKLIDFGIAKAIGPQLAERTFFTEQGQLVGTPEYMSPEQAELSGRHVDTRTDVYALGVLLYELLAGVAPIDPVTLRSASFDEICRTIREEEPDRPSTRLSSLDDAAGAVASARRRAARSTIVRTLRGDLDWITMKAIEKDPARRYQSVSSLSNDIRRHLAHEPVTAGPPTAFYRIGKFARRHRPLVIGAAAVLLVLVAGIVTTAWQARRAAEEAVTSRQVSDFIRNMLSSIHPARARGEVVTVRDLLDEASRKLDASLPDRPRVQAALHVTIGTTYHALGDYAEAEPHMRSAVDIYDRELGPAHPETLYARGNLAVLLKDRGRYQEAEAVAREALQTAQRAHGLYHEATAQLTTNLGNILLALERMSEAEECFRRALDQHRRLYGEEDSGTLIAMTNLGVLLMKTTADDPSRLAEAEPLLTRCLEIRRRTLGADHPDTLLSMQNLAALLANQQRTEESKALLREAVEGAERVLGPTHPMTMRWMRNLAVLFYLEGQTGEAEALLRRLFDLVRTELGEAHPDTLNTLGALVAILTAQAKFEEAEPLARQCYEGTVATFGPDHDEVLQASELFVHLYEAWGKSDLEEQWRTRIQGAASVVPTRNPEDE